MNNCTTKEINEIALVANDIFRKTRGRPMDASKLSNLIELELGVEPGSFDLALYMSGENNLLRIVANKFGIDTQSILENFSGKTMSTTNVSEDLTTYNIVDVFHGIPTAKKFFEGRTNRQMAIKTYINDGKSDTYVLDNETVSKNMQSLKNDLFVNIQDFLISEGVLKGFTEPQNLFTEDGLITSLTHYKMVMTAAAEYFFEGDFDMLTSYTDKKVPNIVKDIKITNRIYEVYSDLIFLNNFDTVIKNNFGHRIKINGNYLDSIEGSPLHDKYYVKSDPKTTAYWSQDTHAQEGVTSLNSKTADMIISSIPAYNKLGEKLDVYMTTNDMYLLAAVIADFELLHGNNMFAEKVEGFDYIAKDAPKQFDWYLTQIMDVINGSETNPNFKTIENHFEDYFNIIHSLYNFMHDEDLNIQVKESTAETSIKDLFGQVLNNSFGAVYHVYNTDSNLTEYQVFSQDFSSTGLQKTVIAKMRSVAHDNTRYSLADTANNTEFEALFDGMDLSVNMDENILNFPNFHKNVSNYLNEKFGLEVTRDILLDTVEKLRKNEANNKKVPTRTFKTLLKGLMTNANADFQNNILSKKAETLKEKNARFEKATAKSMVPLTIKARLYKVLSASTVARFPIKGLMNISTLTGELIPAHKLANLTYKDVDSFSAQRLYKGTRYSNLFIKGHDAVIIGTSTKLEIIGGAEGKKQSNKSASRMIAAESLVADFQYGFLDSLVQTDGRKGSFNVMIGNYSDKGTIISKMINGDWMDEASKTKFKEMSPTDIAEVVRRQAGDYYSDTLESVFKDFTELFDSAGIAHAELKLSKNISDPETEASIKEINRLLTKHDRGTEYDIHDIIRDVNNPNLKITDELHYSRYSDGYRFNQTLADNYRIFNDKKLFGKFKSIQENNFVKKIEDNKIGTSFLSKITKEHLNDLKLDSSDIYKYAEVSDQKTGEFNPVLGKWLWMNALARNEYLFMTTKGEYMHPQRDAKLRYYSENDSDYTPSKPPRVFVSGQSDGESKVKRVTTEKEAAKVLDNIVKDSPHFQITANQKHYEDTRTGKLYERVSNFVESSDIDPNNINVTLALKFGNRFDAMARDFFDGTLASDLNEYGLGDVSTSLSQLQYLKNEMVANGETILAQDVTLHDDNLMLAGTVDLITYDKQGKIRIYDFKTMKDDNFSTKYSGHKLTKYDTTEFNRRSKRQEHTDQISLYSIMANNTYGLETVKAAVIPAVLNYTTKKPIVKKPVIFTMVDINLRTTIEGEIRPNQPQKVAKYNSLKGESTKFDRSIAKRSTDKFYIYANNDGNTDTVRGLVNTLGIDVKKAGLPKKRTLLTDDIRVYKDGKAPSFRTIPLIFGPITNTKGASGAAVFTHDTRVIKLHLPTMLEKYNSKAWLNSATQLDGSKATALPKDAFKSYEEFLTFVILHEYMHSRKYDQTLDQETRQMYAKADSETIGEYEDRINDFAMQDLNNNYLQKESGKKTADKISANTLTDADFNSFKTQVDNVINKALESGKEIVIPKNMGKVELETQAPKLYEYLQNTLKNLKGGKLLPPATSNSAVAFSDTYWKEYMDEVSERLVVMSKRNVTNTSTFETAIRNSVLGTNQRVNIAVVDDVQTGPYSITGETKYDVDLLPDGTLAPNYKQDAHDGYSWMNSVYSKMVDASYPGKGYEGTKKRFGTLVTDHGAMVKKDSEGDITNEKMRGSTKSTINLRRAQEKMLGIRLDGLNLNYSKTFAGEYFFKHLGDFYQVSQLDLNTNEDGAHILDLELKVKGDGDTWTFATIPSMEVDNLFQIWDAVGGEFSTDSNGHGSEGSNDLLYDIVVNTEHFNGKTSEKGMLKDRMVHIISNKTAFKAGATNLNKADVLSSDGNLAHATFNSEFMGVQLDASGNVIGSEINEVTQIISALAQNGYTAELAREAYNDIRNVISEASKPYLKHIANLNNLDLDSVEAKGNFLDYLSSKFVESIQTSARDDIAKALIGNLKKDGIKIPFSNQNFHNSFVKDVITRMNTDFISRKYPGVGATLAASQGIVQVYDVDIKLKDGTTVETQMSQEDVINRALEEFDSNDYFDRHDKNAVSNYDIIDDYIFRNITNKPVLLEDIEIGDTILLDGQNYNLTTPEEYYRFKDIFGDIEISTILGSYEQLNNVSNSVQTLVAAGNDVMAATEFLYGEYRNSLNENVIIGSDTDAQYFTEYVESIDPDDFDINVTTDYTATISAENRVFERVRNVPRDLKPTLHSFRVNGKKRNVFDFQSVKFKFIMENLKNKNFYSYISESDKVILTKLLTYINSEYLNGSAENIDLANIYAKNPLLHNWAGKFLSNWTQRNFSLLDHGLTTTVVDENTGDFYDYFKGDDLMRDVIEDVLPKYANNVVTDIEFKNAELALGDMYQDTFLRESHESAYDIHLKGGDFFAEKLVKDFKVDDTDADYKVVTKSSTTPIYVKYVQELPFSDDSVRMTRDWGDGVSPDKSGYVRKGSNGEVLYRVPSMKDVVIKKENNSDVIYIKWSNDVTRKGHRLNREFERINNTLLKSFGNDLKTIVPLMRDNSIETIVTGDSQIDPYDLNQVTLDLFKKYTGVEHNIPLEKHSIFDVSEQLTQILGDKMYASWQKSLEVVSSRIPAQSMQSFMPMKNIMYIKGSKNDAYVSISQIFLQGSDFDIDKAYIMGHSFNNRGNYNTWSNLTYYTTKSQLDALNKLPKSTGKTVEVVRDSSNYDQVLSGHYGEILQMTGEINLSSLSAEVINVFNKMIRHINKNDLDTISIQPNMEAAGFEFDIVADLINRHNVIEEGRDAENALKNKVVSKIQEIISAPSNQLMANSPITIDAWHKVAPKYVGTNINEGTQIYTENTPYDMLSYYILQQNAAVGKEDVGIAANGVKSFFALTDYFNDFYRNNSQNLSPTELKRSNELFHKEFVFHTKWNTINYSANTIADIQMNRANVNSIKDINGNYVPNYSNAALILSGLLSAATDNAKELLMAKINATPELFSMHLYLAVIGLDMKQIVDIMTSDVANDVVKMSEHNMFEDSYKQPIHEIFETLEKSATGKDKENLDTFIDIYHSSKEFSALAGLLGVNQKRKANPWEVYKYLARFENIFDSTNERMFQNHFANADKYTAHMKAEKGSTWIETTTDILMKKNPLMEGQRDYVKNVVKNAGNMIYDGLDFRKYFKNPEYKQAAKEYYNVIKNTFNVFDVMDNAPHFKGMVDSLVLTHDMLLNASERYKFVYGYGKDAVQEGKYMNEKFKRKGITKPIFDRMSEMFSMGVIEQWARTEASHINFDLKSLMKKAGVSDYILYLTEGVKDEVTFEDGATARKITESDTSNPRISLDSIQGIAMFKRIMEDLIIPIAKKTIDSEFINSLNSESMITSMGLEGTGLTSSHSLQELNTLNSLAKFDELINDFDSLDTRSGLVGAFKNNVGSSLKLRDLIFLYNLVVHKEKYGNKKLTPILENYMKEPGSLGYNYIKYFSKVDTGDISIYENLKNKYGSKWEQKLKRSIFFHINNLSGETTVETDGVTDTLGVTNPEIAVIFDVEHSPEINRTFNTINELASLIREKGWVVTLEC